MYSVHKIFSYRKSEGGFVLIAALMAVMILMALGYFILTATTQDLRMSARLISERKAFSAAECGLHTLCLTFDPTMTALTNQACDSAGDPNSKYDITAPVLNPTLPTIDAIGYEITSGKKSVYVFYLSTVTGKDTSYNSSVPVEVGVKFGPVPDDPSYH